MDKIKKLLGNITIFGISQFSSKLLTFFLLPFYTSYLTTAEFGEADLVFSVVSLLLPVFTIEIATAVMRYTIEKETEGSRFFANGLVVITIGFFLLLLMYPLFVVFHLFDGYLHLFYIMYFSSAIYTLLSNYARGLQRVNLVGISGIVNTCVIIISNIVFLAVFQTGIQGYLLAYILGYLLAAVLLAVGTVKHLVFSAKDVSFSLQKEMAQYSLPLAPNNVAWWGVSSANKIAIQAYLNSDILGIYSAALKVPSIINVLQSIISEGLVLSVLDQYQTDNPDNQYYSFLYRAYSSFSIFIVAGVIVFSRFIVAILFSAEFESAWLYVPLLCISPVWGALSGFLGTFYAASKNNNGMFISTVLGAVITLAVAIFGLPYLGIYAIMYGNIVAYFAIWLYRWLDVRKIVSLEVNMKADVLSWLLLIVLAHMATCEMDTLVLVSLMIVVIVVLLVLNQEILLSIWQIAKKLLIKSPK